MKENDNSSILQNWNDIFLLQHYKKTHIKKQQTEQNGMECFQLESKNTVQWSHGLTSVTASREAECLSSRSIDLMWFFLQAICRGVKPFWT